MPAKILKKKKSFFRAGIGAITLANTNSENSLMARPGKSRTDNLRRTIAAEAARIMAEHGISDYGMAKRKAADRLGVSDQHILPRNVEIESALHEHLHLFESHKHDDRLEKLRRVAISAMRMFQDFEPRLVGSVLSGTATAHSDINLHVFTDTPEHIAMCLMNHGIPYRDDERRVRTMADQIELIPAYVFDANEVGIDATVFPGSGLRRSPCSPIDGKPMHRAAIDDVRTLLNDRSNDPMSD